MTDDGFDAPRHFVMGVCAVAVLGLGVRLWHLDVPLRYDEAVTWFDFASPGWKEAATAYTTPNNHILHSLLVWLGTSLFGSDVWAIRLPALAAGTLVPVGVAWAGRRLYGARIGLLAGVVAATTPVLVEYSVNARGYSLLALAVVAMVAVGDALLERPGPGLWAAWVAAGVVGFYTIPIMAIPWTGLTLWLGVNVAGLGDGRSARLRRLRPVAYASIVTVAVVGALYLPVWLRNGSEALFGNRFVEGMGWAAFAASIPGALEGLLESWTKGMPWLATGLGGVGLVAALAPGHPGGERRVLPLPWALLLGSALVMLVVRNPGEARIWLWALPLIGIATAAGLVRLTGLLARGRGRRWAVWGVGFLWVVAQAVGLSRDRPVQASAETGTFPDVRRVADFLEDRLESNDVILTDHITLEPLRYYLWDDEARAPLFREEVNDSTRAWVVTYSTEPARDSMAHAHAARLGIPLDRSTPLARVGNALIFRFVRTPGGG